MLNAGVSFRHSDMFSAFPETEPFDVIVSNPIISRAHAKISCHNGTCTIQDLGSKNGTFVGDQKISGNNIVVLTDGMYITLGNEIFQFKV